MKNYDWDLDKAYKYCFSKRELTCPNLGYFHFLKIKGLESNFKNMKKNWKKKENKRKNNKKLYLKSKLYNI